MRSTLHPTPNMMHMSTNVPKGAGSLVLIQMEKDSMELTIHKENDMWTAHVGGQLEEQKIFPLGPASESLFRWVTAIHNCYPGSKVWIDPQITPNPFLAKALFIARYYGLAPLYQDVQETIDNSQEKVCNLCASRACYNASVRGWVCTNCGAHESFIDRGRFFKLSRNARKG